MTAEYLSAFLGQLRNMVQASNSETLHTELQSSRIKKDEQAVSSIVDLIQGWVNPFSESHNLICISTAKTAPREIALDWRQHMRSVKDVTHILKKRGWRRLLKSGNSMTLWRPTNLKHSETRIRRNKCQPTTDRLFWKQTGPCLEES